jgi:hypothetical protein
MTTRGLQVGFSQRIRLEWFERTANLVLSGNGKEAIDETLQGDLKEKVSVGGNAVRGNREKIITILMRTWVSPSNGIHPLHAEGLDLLKALSRDQHVVVHWGMVLATYPFWGTVAEQVGRLLKLQGTATAAQVQRRIAEQIGQRETAARATRRILRTFVDWGVLSETGQKGIYGPGLQVRVDDPHLVAWLITAQLHALPEGRGTVANLTDARCLFPFTLARPGLRCLHEFWSRIESISDGSGEEVVFLNRAHEKWS